MHIKIVFFSCVDFFEMTKIVCVEEDRYVTESDLDNLMQKIAEANIDVETRCYPNSPFWYQKKSELELYFQERGVYRRKKYTEAEIDALVARLIPLPFDEHEPQPSSYSRYNLPHLLQRRAYERSKMMARYRIADMLEENDNDESDLPPLEKEDVEELKHWKIPVSGPLVLRRRMWKKKLNDEKNRYIFIYENFYK